MTVDELAREAVGAVDMEEGYLLALKWISRRYQEVVAKIRYLPLMKFGSIVVPGVYKVGLASFVQGSQNVVGNGTVWTNAFVGRFLRRFNNWYEIQSVEDATHLILSLPYLDRTENNVPYNIIPRRVPLVSGVGQVREFRVEDNPKPLEILGIDELDVRESERSSIGSTIYYAAEVGTDSNSIRVFEFYPYPNKDKIVNFTYFAFPADLAFTDIIPEFIGGRALKEGVLIDVYRFQMGKALKEGRTDVAGFWRNELRAQETSWGNILQEIIQTSSAVDDGTLLLRTGRKTSFC